MNNILVTGADGQLGSSLRDLEAGYPEFNFLFTDYKELDITSLQSINSYFKQHKIHYVINCAAYTAVDKAESEPEKARLLNTIAVSYLAQAAGFFGATMIHISTDYVFDGTSVSPISEDVETSPLGVYGRTKLDGEEYVLGYSKGIVIRTAWLYSEYGGNFVKTMRRLGAEKEEIGVVCDQVGTPTYAGDLAVAIMQIIRQGATKYGLYHFSNEGSCSWAQFAMAIMACSGLKCRVNPITTDCYPTPAERPKYSILDKSKIKNDYNLTIHDWELSLTKMVAERSL